MTWPLVKLRVSALTHAGVKAALLAAGDEGLLRINDPGKGDLNLDGVVLVLSPATEQYTALRMVREAIEELFGPEANLESEDAILLRGPQPHHEAEAIIAALQNIRGKK